VKYRFDDGGEEQAAGAPSFLLPDREAVLQSQENDPVAGPEPKK
jgi:hypothetical protein